MSAPLALRGRVALPDEVLPDAVVLVEDGLITSIVDGQAWTGEATRVALVTPGLIDIHCHGGGGTSVTTGDVADIEAVAAHHLARGTTSMLASLVSADADALTRAVSAIGQVTSGDSPVVGAHLEGPFLGHGHCGAHEPAALITPDAAIAQTWLDAAAGTLRMITIAPELPHAAEVAATLEQAGVLVALGHTDADEATFAAALGVGDRVVTHLFNGMAPLHHRDPGPVGATLRALADRTCHAELIADGVHLDDATVAMVFAIAAERVVLVSDAMAAAGMPDGSYQLGPMTAHVRGGVARTADDDTSSLAGSTAHLADAVRRCLAAGLDEAAVLRAATATPAALLGLTDRGRIEPGLRADLVCWDEGGAVSAVLRGGTWVE